MTVDYQRRLRGLNQHPLVNDLFILDIAMKLGAVDSEDRGLYPTYRPLEEVSDEQLLMMLSNVALLVEELKISPGESAGLVSAHSISEPITQSVMRTFHYAGILTKESPLVLLNTDVSMSAPKRMAHAIAIKPPYNKNYQYVKELAHKLGRSKLSDYAHVERDSIEIREFQMRKRMDDINEKIDSFPRNRYVGDSNEYTSEFEALIDEKRKIYQKNILDAIKVSKNNSLIVYLKIEKDDKDEDHWKPMTPGDLFRCINLQFKEGDGSYRTYGKQILDNGEPNPLYYIWKEATVEPIETEYKGKANYAISINFPGLPARLFLALLEEMRNIEFCNNCSHPTTLAKLVNSKKKGSTDVIEDPTWDTSKPIDSYYDKVLESLKDSGYKQNPPEIEEDSTGIIEFSAAELSSINFSTADNTEHKRCRNCDHGWLHFNSDSVLVGPLRTGTMDTDQEPYTALDKLLPQADDDPFLTSDELPSALFNERPVVQIGNSVTAPFLYPGVGGTPGMSVVGRGQSDYPTLHARDGHWVADPQDDEFFILAFINEHKRTGDRTSGFIGQGGWLRTVKTFASNYGILDFERTTCSDVRQVENVLGIEAARSVLFHNLMFSINDAGETHLKHALLLADAMCSHNVVKTAPAGRGSIAGMNSQMGNRTELFSDGTMENYGSVLAQAYERQVQVVLDRSVVGLVDDLNHPKSAQIVGIAPRGMGTLSNASEGRYSSASLESTMRAYADFAMGKKNGKQNLDKLLSGGVHVVLLEAIENFSKGVIKQMEQMSLEKTDMFWITGNAPLWPELPLHHYLKDGTSVPMDRPEHILHREKRAELLQDNKFMELLNQYGAIVELREYILGFIGI